MGKAAASHQAEQERRTPQVSKTRCVFPLTKVSKIFKIIFVNNVGQ